MVRLFPGGLPCQRGSLGLEQLRASQSPSPIGAQTMLFARSLKSARREGASWSARAWRSSVVVTIAYAHPRKYTGNIAVVGPAYFELILREFAPMLTTLLAASRQAASTSAELREMSVNEQVEALEPSAADPLAELVAPRIIASTLSMLLLLVVGTFFSTLSAVPTVTYAFGADGGAFMDPSMVGALTCCARS